jgi:hypothetical protein
MLEQALEIYNGSELHRNEIARTKYKLGCVLQDSGDVSRGRAAIEEAENMRKEILPKEDWALNHWRREFRSAHSVLVPVRCEVEDRYWDDSRV